MMWLLDDDEDGRMGRHSSPPFVYLAASYLRQQGCWRVKPSPVLSVTQGTRFSTTLVAEVSVTTLMEDSTEASSLVRRGSFSAVVAGRLAICTPEAVTTLMEDSEPSSVSSVWPPTFAAWLRSHLRCRRRESGRPYSAGKVVAKVVHAVVEVKSDLVVALRYWISNTALRD
ncbi:hypothetical protein LZ32DRAFT_74393 [Colletotrichum eremochloae]|nr:hypothetical protein LZ32DRAFT_74393 [Colletotrichum eremochloae]